MQGKRPDQVEASEKIAASCILAIIIIVSVLVLLQGCSRSMTPFQAAQRPQKCGIGSVR